MNETLRIKDWSQLYENHRTRTLQSMSWVPVPNTMDGDGYTELMDHPNGAAHLGAWLAILQIASKCDPRGTLVRDGSKPHTAYTLARISRIQPAVFEEAIPRLLGVHWLELAKPNLLTLEQSSREALPSFDFEAFFEAAYARHPKKGNRNIAAQYLTEVLLRDVQPEQLEKMHLAWCESDAWTKGGAGL